MRKLALLAALAVGSAAVPASAAEFYVLSPGTIATGSVLTTTINASCGGFTFVCSVETVPVEVRLTSAILYDFGRVGNTQTLGYSDTNARLGGTITLTYEGANLLTSAFTGTSDTYQGNCPSACVLRRGTYSASNFSLTLYDGNGGSRIIAPVPEPGTWALMLLGFGAIGATLRRRRSALIRFAV